MDAVEEAFYYAKGEETPEIDLMGEVGLGGEEGADGETLAEGEVVGCQVCGGGGWGEVGCGFGGVSGGRGGGGFGGKGDVSVAFLLHFGTVDEVGYFGCAGVDGGEGEDVEEEDAAVVEEVAEGFLNEFVVRVGEEGDLFDGVDAVDVREDEQHG